MLIVVCWPIGNSWSFKNASIDDAYSEDGKIVLWFSNDTGSYRVTCQSIAGYGNNKCVVGALSAPVKTRDDDDPIVA